MGGGSGGGNTTTTQKADPWIGVQPYLESGYQQLSDLYQPGQGPAYYPGQTVAPPSALEQQGQQMQLGGADRVQQLADLGLKTGYEQAYYANQGSDKGMAYSGQGAGGLGNLAGQLGGGAGGAQSAMQQLLGYGASGATQQGTGGTVNAMQQLAQAGDFQNNPAFQQALQSAIRPVTQQFQEQVMPGIKQGAQAAGQMGGSRQGVAEGIASRGYMDTVGDISANMGNQAYVQGLQALQASGQLGAGLSSQGLGATSQAGALGQGMAGLQGQAYSNLGGLGSSMYGTGLQGLGQSLALSPTNMAGQTMPGQITSGLGQQNTADQQAQIDAQMAKYNYGENLPYAMIQDYLSALNGGASLGGSQVSQQQGAGSNRATGALGGAASGAAIGSAFGPGYGTAIGAGLGAMYGLFA